MCNFKQGEKLPLSQIINKVHDGNESQEALALCLRVQPHIEGKMQMIVSSLGIRQTCEAGAEILRLQLQGRRQHYLRENVSLPWSEIFPSLPKRGPESCR